jgi:hypothetical protein
MTQTPDVSDEHHKFQLRSRAARMLSLVELPIGNLTSDMNYQVCVKQDSVCYMFIYSPNRAVSILFHLCSYCCNSALHIIIIIFTIIIIILCLFLCLCETCGLQGSDSLYFDTLSYDNRQS